MYNINKYIIFLLLIIVITYIFFNYISINDYDQNVNYEVYHIKNILSPDECNKLIRLSTKFEFDTDPDPTDDKPEYQIDIITSRKRINNKTIWKEIKPIYENKLIPILNTIPFLFSVDYNLDFVFLKRYKPNERRYMSLHTDENFFTIGILLSNSSEFSGGELYIFDRDKSKEYDDIDKLDTEEKDEFIKNYKNLPIINYNQGDIVVYSGNNHLHGTLPLIKGERYVLIFFFNKKK